MGLVAVEEVRTYAGLQDAGAETMLQDLIDQVEALFLAQVGRTARPYQQGGTGRVEVWDGTGSRDLYLDYPVKALTAAITLGYVSPWDESLTPTDPAVLSFQVGSRRLVRVDGGRFGELGKPNYVRVTYDAADDLPDDVRMAVIRMVTALARESGLGESTANRTLPDGEDLPAVQDVVAADMWQAAIAVHREVTVG